MSYRPPPPPLIVLRTTRKLLNQTTTSIFSTGQNLLIFLFLSLILFSIRVNVEMATHFLTSLIDNDPSFKSIIDRNNAPPNRTSPTSMITTKRSLLKPQLNSTSFIRDSFDPQTGFSDFVPENGIRASEIIPSTSNLTFRSIEIIQKEENNDSSPFNETYFQSFLNRFEIELNEFTSLVIFTLGFGVSYWFIIDVIIPPFHLTFSNGSYLGSSRLTCFIAMTCGIRSFFTQLICLCFLLGIEDSYSFLNFLVRSKYMLIPTMSPRDRAFKKENFGFMIFGFLLDMLMSLLFDMGAWIVMVDSRKNVKEAVKEGCHLMSLMIKPAIELKCDEYIVCRVCVRWILTRSFGVLFGLAFQSLMEVSFMVAWLMYYLSVKSIDANPNGQPLGQRELEVEAMLRDVRFFMIGDVNSYKCEVVVF